MEADPRAIEEVHVLACVDCPRVSTVTARGWRAYLVADADDDDRTTLAFRCPACALRELDG